MDTISSITQENISNQLNKTKVFNPKSNIDKEAFLKLLVAQLKYQDPLNPLTNNQFIEENTMFSQLEQLTNLNDSVKTLMNNITNNNRIAAASYIGKYISTGTEKITVSGSHINSLSFSIPEKADVIASISNAKGDNVAMVDLGTLSSGIHTFKWNGKDNKGNQVSDGIYTVNFVAKSESGTFVPVEGYSGKVVSVIFSGNNVFLETDTGKKININNVESVSGG